MYRLFFSVFQDTALESITDVGSPKEAACQVCAFHPGYRGQWQLRTHIPNGIDAGHRGLVLAIHLDAAILLQLYTHLPNILSSAGWRAAAYPAALASLLLHHCCCITAIGDGFGVGVGVGVGVRDGVAVSVAAAATAALAKLQGKEQC